MCDFCSSKRRKLKCGKIVNESKHNLSRYKTAVSHCFSVYRVEHADEVFDHAKVETYKMTCKHFFDSIKKQENDLKAKGRNLHAAKGRNLHANAGKGRRPVRPYSKLTYRDFKGSPWRKTSKNMSKWRKLFEWISQQLTDSDTISHRWQVDGPTHFRTFNRIRKLLPGAQGNYKIDPGRRSVSTTYGILVKKLKKEREAAAEADAASTG